MSTSIPVGLKFTTGQALVAAAAAPALLALGVAGGRLWLGIVLVLSVLASVLPARNAASLTIREVLAYE